MKETRTNSRECPNNEKRISKNRIIGELITREKYKFVDGKLIASIVDDVVDIVIMADISGIITA